jgi:hypothetical protein
MPRSRTRQDEQDNPVSPEALVISALLEEGRFPLSEYRLGPEDFSCWEPLVDFCVRHQEQTGRGPSLPLIRHKYPDFEIVPDIDPHWAAGELRTASAGRNLHEKFGLGMAALRDGDVYGAYDAVSSINAPALAMPSPRSGFDVTGHGENTIPLFDVPWHALRRVVRGIYPKDLIYWGARQSFGKSAMGACITAKIVQQGGRAIIWSMEMPAEDWNRRIRRCLTKGNRELQERLESDDYHTYKMALDELRELVPGDFFTADPQSGAITIEAIRDSLRDYDFAVVDHVGLLKNKAGMRFSDDWRPATQLSNLLREAVLETATPVLGLVQINREGDHVSPWRVPRLSELSQSDALGMDGTVIINMQKFSTSVRLCETVKVREHGSARWFTRFQPAFGNYEQITTEQAKQLAAIDEDRELIDR